MEKEIKITAKLYQCRDTAKRFFGADFNDRIAPYKHLIMERQKASGKEVLECLVDCLSLQSIQENGMATLMFSAAVVEIIEE